MLREEQVRRYARHVLLPDVGGKGQERLLAARVRVLEAGGAGGAAIAYLAAAGVGTICVLDEGLVEVADVGALYEREDVGKKRLDAVKKRVSSLNPDVTIVATSDAPDDICPPTPATAGSGAGTEAGIDDAFDPLLAGATLAATLIRAIARGNA